MLSQMKEKRLVSVRNLATQKNTAKVMEYDGFWRSNTNAASGQLCVVSEISPISLIDPQKKANRRRKLVQTPGNIN